MHTPARTKPRNERVVQTGRPVVDTSLLFYIDRQTHRHTTTIRFSKDVLLTIDSPLFAYHPLWAATTANHQKCEQSFSETNLSIVTASAAAVLLVESSGGL